MKAKQLTMPMFPLAMLLLPGETTKLHIFEDRYLQLVNECLENNASFGIPYLEKGKVQEYGAEVRIKRILKNYESGGMDILIEATNLFQAHRIFKNTETQIVRCRFDRIHQHIANHHAQ